MENFHEYLSELDEEFERISYSPMGEIPDGKYQCKIDRISLDKTKNGLPLLKYGLKIIQGDYVGRFLNKSTLIVSGDKLKWLKQEMSICGIDCKKLSELKDRLNEFLDINLEITKRTNGEYTNIYFNKKITINNIPYDKTYLPDDDIPF
jgi:hypothetical protein